MEFVSDLMTPSPQVVPHDTSVAEAAKILLRLGFRHLLVVRDGVLCGVLTDFALFRHGGFVGAHEELWVAYDEAAGPTLVHEVMVEAELCVGPDSGLVATLRELADASQDVVAVVDEHRRPVGILTEHDAVRLAVGVMPEGATTRDNGSWPARSVGRLEPAGEALAHMQEAGMRHLIVVEPDSGDIFGVLSLGDLLADGAGLDGELRAEDCVRTHRLISVTGHASMRRVARLMARHHIGCVPVLSESGRPIAVVTRTDVLEALVAALEQEQLFET